MSLGFLVAERTAKSVAHGIWVLVIYLAFVPAVMLLFVYLDQIAVIEARGDFCSNCGYDLTGNTSGRCPECGTPTAMRGGA
jgi:hypothetical protein